MVIKVIIFDLGNVLLKFDMGIVSRAIAKKYFLDEPKLLEFFFDSPITAMHDEGKINAKEFHRRAMAEHNINMDFDEFKKLWNSIFIENKEVVKLVSSLVKSKKYKIFLMSNTNKLHFDYLKEKFAIIKKFDEVFTSYEIGERKPHPKIYKAAIEAAGAKPEELVFIDDREELVEGARKLGIMAVPFKDSVSQLREDLWKEAALKI